MATSTASHWFYLLQALIHFQNTDLMGQLSPAALRVCVFHRRPPGIIRLPMPHQDVFAFLPAVQDIPAVTTCSQYARQFPHRCESLLFVTRQRLKHRDR